MVTPESTSEESQSTEMQLDTSLLVGLHQSPPSPKGKAEDTAPEGWTNRSLNGHTGRADSTDTSTATKTYRPQYQRTHTHQTKPQGIQTKMQALGPLHRQSKDHVGRGPLMTSPGIGTRTAHRQADISSYQPACRKDT